MPFVVNGLKMCDKTNVRPGRTGLAMTVIFVLALAVAVPVVLGSNYSRGVPLSDRWATVNVPKFPFELGTREINSMELRGQLETATSLSGLERLAHAEADPSFLVWAGIGLTLVIVVGVLRLRFAWWPLHPVIFLVWGSYPMWRLSHSFLLGWFIKSAVVKLGGTKGYQTGKALMIGAIAGEMFAGLIWMGIGASYYAITGEMPESYVISPG
jgi:hypothetical protein